MHVLSVCPSKELIPKSAPRQTIRRDRVVVQASSIKRLGTLFHPPLDSFYDSVTTFG